MTEKITTKVLIVGGGPGGYVAGIRCGQLGLDTVLVEAARLGGTCLNVGCIPSKAVIHVAGEFEAMAHTAAKPLNGISLTAAPKIDFAETVKWKDGVVKRLNTGVAALLKRAKVRTVEGWAVFSDAKTCTVKTKGGEVTIAARARHPRQWLAAGRAAVPAVRRQGDLVHGGAVAVGAAKEARRGRAPAISGWSSASRSASWAARSRWSRRWTASCRSTMRRWCSRWPNGWRRTASPCIWAPRRRGLGKDGLAAELKDGTTVDIAADNILVTVGRKPATDGWGLENMAVDMQGRFVRVDDQCRTSMKDVWAVGDLVGEPMLEHKAAKQGEMVAKSSPVISAASIP